MQHQPRNLSARGQKPEAEAQKSFCQRPEEEAQQFLATRQRDRDNFQDNTSLPTGDPDALIAPSQHRKRWYCATNSSDEISRKASGGTFRIVFAMSSSLNGHNFPLNSLNTSSMHGLKLSSSSSVFVNTPPEKCDCTTLMPSPEEAILLRCPFPSGRAKWTTGRH